MTISESSVIAPVLVPMTDNEGINAFLIEQVESSFNDIRIGVQFDPRGKVYAYLAPPIVRIGSVVMVPPNRFRPAPQMVDVVTLDPPACPVPLKRVLAVLT